jgi:gliding motility-associated-like protein
LNSPIKNITLIRAIGGCTFTLVLMLFAIANLSAQALEFTENKGQWHNDVLYEGRLSAGNLYLIKGGYKVLQYHPDDYGRILNMHAGHNFLHTHANTVPLDIDPDLLRFHAYSVKFYGANPQAVTFPDKRLPGYANYYLGNDPDKWKSEVFSYNNVTYKNIYRDIDVHYYSDKGFVKYDIVAAAGAPVEKIILHYEGVTDLKVIKGNLVIKTSVGEVIEQKPYAFQVTANGRKEVGCQYQVKGNMVTFKLNDYNPGLPLVIDPTFVFSTYAGSVPDNWGYTATFDKDGNAYGGGIVMGAGYPVSTGAFQSSFQGGTGSSEGPNGFDISIIKLDPQGRNRLYSTYLGGSSNEQPHSLVVDNDGNLIVAGRTLSGNYPTRGAGAIGAGGQWDIVVTKFNATGTNLIGSVKIGGGGDDGVNDRHKFPNPQPAFTNQNYGDDARSEVITDGAGNIYVAASTKSSNFPVTNGAIQSNLRGAQDALVLKFNANLTNLDFATYLGGSGYDAAYVLTVEEGGDVLVAGGTMSNDFPGDKLGTVGASFEGGNLDGFIARISSNGNTLRKVTYIGTAGNDQLYGIQKDKNGFLYVMGTSTGSFPVRNAPFSQTGGKQFIAKLLPDFTAYVYSTVFGTNNPFPNISPTAFLVDNCENVYVSGWGGNIIPGTAYPIAPTTGLTVTPDAIKSNTDGIDFYFFVLEKNATRQLYGSFFGQQDAANIGSHDHVDGGTSRFDENGIIYQGICANCNGGLFPTTPGTVSPSNPSLRCNLAIVKIDFNLSGVRTGVQSFIDGVRRDSSSCVPATIEFVDSIAVGKRFEWSFGDGSPILTTDTPLAVHTFRQAGNYRVRLIAIDEEKCIPRDTAFVNVRVRLDRIQMNANADLLPPCESLNYRFNNLSIPFPGKPFRDSSFIWNFGDNSPVVRAGTEPVTHRYANPGTYNVRLILADTNYCNAPDTFHFQVRVSPNVVARFEAPANGCAPLRVNFNNTSLGGTSFFWDFGNGQTSTAANPTVVFTQPGQYRVKMVALDPNTCNVQDSGFFTINVSGAPTAAFNYSPQPSEENIPTTFTNLSSPASLFFWDFGDSTTLVTVRRDTLVRHQYPRTDVFNTCLVAINELGCADTVCQVITATVTPIIDVVTAFTPNGDGTNDRAVVYGFGVVKMTFRIFNRWGQLMYEGSDPQQGWDGKFKGQPQPMDAYAYTLDAELIDGSKVRKSGNITLIR